MKLNTILTSGSWVEIADLLNDNFSKIAIAIDLGIDGDGGGGITIYDVEKYLEQYKYTTQDDVSAMLSPYVLKREVTPVITDLNTRVASIEMYFSTEEESDNTINKWNEIVAFLDGIKGDTLDNILITKADKATTLAGYGITDAYTKAETDGKYLPLTGGQLATKMSTILTLNNTNSINNEVGLKFDMDGASKGWVGYTHNTGTYLYTYAGPHKLGIKDDGTGFIDGKTILNSGNYSNYAVRSLGEVGANYSRGNWVGFTSATSADGGKVSGGLISAGLNSWGFQLNGDDDAYGLYFRYFSPDSFSDWKALAFTSDIPTKLSQLTDDVVAGKYLPLSGGTITSQLRFGKDLYENAQTLIFRNASTTVDYGTVIVNQWDSGKTVFTLDRNSVLFRSVDNVENLILHSGNYSDYTLPITGGTVNGSITISDTSWARQLSLKTTSTDAGIRFYINESMAGILFTNVLGRLQWGDANKNYDIIHSNNIGSYNAGSATKLTTSRTIWGQSFDGTGNVTGFPSFPYYIDINRNADTGAIMNSSVLGCEIQTYSSFIAIKSYSSEGDNITSHLCLIKGGNVAIGGTTADEKLHVHGNGKFTGTLTVSGGVNDYEERIAALEEKTKNL